MEKKKVSFFKIFLSMLFASGVLAMYFYVIFKGDLKYNILAFACVGACFLLSAIFLRLTTKKIFITLALLINVAADLLLVTSLFGKVTLNNIDKVTQAGTYLFCAVQLMYVLYNLSLYKGVGLKIVNIAIRVAGCLLVYFIVPKYVTLSTLQLVAIMYLLNSALSVLSLLFYLKKEWLLFLGLLLLFAAHFVTWLIIGGGIGLLHIDASSKFVEILLGKYNISFICYIPALLLIALSSVWAPKKKKE